MQNDLELDRIFFNKLTHDQQRALAIQAVKDAILHIAKDGTTGGELLTRLSATGQGIDIPVAVITGCVRELLAERYLASADGYHLRTVRAMQVD
jgi:CheY-like chemotaxis protein